MLKLRYFFLSMNVLNGLLAVAVAAVVFFAVIPFLDPAVMSLPPAKETVARSGEKAAPSQSSSPADYAVISEQNLFHPERKIPPEKQQEKVIPKPELFLYGTLITNDGGFAFIEDKKAPYSTEGRGKRQITLKKGDSLSGYTLSEVEANRVVFIKGEDKLVVTLDDREKRRAGRASASPATIGSAPGGTTPFQPAASSFPQAAPSPGPGMGVPGSRPPSQPFVSPSSPAAPSSAQEAPLRGPAADGSRLLPTRSEMRQELLRKINAQRPMSPQ